MSIDVTFADLQPEALAVVELEVKGPESVPAVFGDAVEEVVRVAGTQALALTGPPVAHYSPSLGHWRIAIGLPVTGLVQSEGRVRPASFPGGHMAIATYAGPYAELAELGTTMRDHAIVNGLECDADWWERYLDDPDATMPRTQILIACRPVRALEPVP